MKKNKSNIEDKVRLTLEELDHLAPIEASHFFFSKLNQRMATSEVKKRGFYSRVFNFEMLSPTMLVLLIAINLISIIKLFSSKSTVKTDQQSMLDNIAESYASTTSVESIYYINADLP